MSGDFLKSGKELDELSMEGFFGADARNLVIQRDSMPLDEYLYMTLIQWNNTEQLGKNKVKEFILRLFTIYTEALKKGGQEAIDIISAFWQGTEDNPELECMSSYNEAVTLNQECKNLLADLKDNKKIKLSERKKLSQALLNTYSKNVELSSKILTALIVEKKIALGETYNLIQIYKKTLHNKIEIFESLVEDSFKSLTSVINREVRNADSHLSISYDSENDQFVYKKSIDGRIENKRIDLIHMMFNVIPSIGWLIQGFIYSSNLFILMHENKDLYRKSVKELFNIQIP